MPGFVAVVQRGNYLAVVFEREEQAINGARALRAEWSSPAEAPFPSSDNLYDFIRNQEPVASSNPIVSGDPDSALSTPGVVEAEYEIPFQGHTAIGPAHALADPSNGQMTIYSNDMKSYGLRNGVAFPRHAARQGPCCLYGWSPGIWTHGCR
jgi:hypothetical protein